MGGFIKLSAAGRKSDEYSRFRLGSNSLALATTRWIGRRKQAQWPQEPQPPEPGFFHLHRTSAFAWKTWAAAEREERRGGSGPRAPADPIFQILLMEARVTCSDTRRSEVGSGMSSATGSGSSPARWGEGCCDPALASWHVSWVNTPRGTDSDMWVPTAHRRQRRSLPRVASGLCDPAPDTSVTVPAADQAPAYWWVRPTPGHLHWLLLLPGGW